MLAVLQGKREFRFDPPLALKGKVVVQTLDDAADVVRRYKDAQRPVLQDGLLRKLEPCRHCRSVPRSKLATLSRDRPQRLVVKPPSTTICCPVI